MIGAAALLLAAIPTGPAAPMANAAPQVGIVAAPCAQLPADAPPGWYTGWIVSDDPAARLPPSDPETQAAAAAAREAHARYDWPNLCRYRAANAALADDPARVVFIGNSITEFWAVADPQFFTGHNVDRGISGQTTPQTLARFMADVVALKPRVVHIWTGINDIAGNGGPTTLPAIEDNIRAMATIARANHIAVVLASVSPARDFSWRPGLAPAPRIVALNAWLKDYAAANDCIYADYYPLLNDGQGGMQARFSRDGVHPNRAGYAAIRPLAERAIAAAQAADNRAIVTDFADIFYRQHDVKRAFETYVAPDYIQHNPGIGDGRAAAIAALTPLFATPETFTVQQILVDGDLAAIHLIARERPDAAGTAVVDMFRLAQGKIVEHWDVLQAVPAQSANPHPMF